MKKVLFIVCLSCLLFNCKSKPPDGRLVFAEPVFLDTIFLKGQLLNDSFVMSNSKEIDHYRDYIFITTTVDGKMLHIFDKYSGDFITSAIAFGRGPGEIQSYQQQTQILPSGDCFVLEMKPQRFTKFNLDSLAANKLVFEKIEYPFHPRIFTERIFRAKDGWLAYETVSKLVQDEMPPRRFTFVKDDGNIYYYDKYPVNSPDEEERANIVTNYRDYQKMVFSPDHTRMAVGEMFGAILEIFDLSDSIKLQTVKPFYDPGKFEAVRGFVDMYATDSHVYALIGEDKDEKVRANTIMKFDWEGNPVNIYKTDVEMKAISIDEKRRKIYANGINDIVINIYQFDM